MPGTNVCMPWDTMSLRLIETGCTSLLWVGTERARGAYLDLKVLHSVNIINSRQKKWKSIYFCVYFFPILLTNVTTQIFNSRSVASFKKQNLGKT